MMAPLRRRFTGSYLFTGVVQHEFVLCGDCLVSRLVVCKPVVYTVLRNYRNSN